LWLSIINNLGILGIFKYYNFFAVQFRDGLEVLGLHTNPVLLNIALPVGISFYTFHGMSYVFDIYRGQQKPVKNFVDYAVFVSFFPLLVAGPIERASHLLPQVQKSRKFNYNQAVEGCRLILWGMFKKVVIADSLAPIVDAIFNNYQNESGITLIIGAIAFSFQIYGDFSGYSDIALGTAKLFGFELLSNFKFPYFSRDIAEFWRRWHISLSSWFKDYLYIPLGGSKEGKAKAIRNTFIIFLVSGFWHGASWNFIAWGFIHACGFLPLLLLKRNRMYTSDVVAEGKLLPSVSELFQMLGTFAFVTLAWVFFRMSHIGDAFHYITRIIGSDFLEYRTGVLFYKIFIPLSLILTLLIMDWNNRQNERNPSIFNYRGIWSMSFLVLLVLIHFFRGENNADFIYFQF
jgi:D-alanyl-lipoteichoic acid acyltransferase DltB (MBOAT superfamily)